MQKVKGVTLRQIIGEWALMADDVSQIDLNCIIHLNETARDIWEHLGDREFTEDDVVEYLTETYDVDPATAKSDATALLARLKDCKVITD